MNSTRLASVLLIFVLNSSHQCNAELVTFQFSGRIVNILAPDPARPGRTIPVLIDEYRIGDTITGMYTFSDSQIPTTSESTFATYRADLLTFEVGSYAATGVNGRIEIRNNDMQFGDFYSVSFFNVNGPPVSGSTQSLTSFGFQLPDLSSTAFSSTALPNAPPNLNAFSRINSFGSLQFGRGTNDSISSFVTIERLEAVSVPEVSAFVFFYFLFGLTPVWQLCACKGSFITPSAK